MDWRNDESDHSSVVENFAWDERNFLSKTMSDIYLSGALGCNVCSQGVQANFGNCKESRSFTSALERLELEAEIEFKNETIPLRRTSDAQTEPSDDIDQELFGLNARDILSYRKTVQHSNILNFQGVMHSPEDIARYWKKDSRMWLWKSVKLTRRMNKCKPPNDMCIVNKETEEKQ
ncbi:hypothetical protein WH47_04814 [Habropoda laboriosa]|uniref:Uncharacterized protein n=1 Tax=Habropoda laboriosa TaxID=597456 RepID=A0A0L7QVR6_9HYME|nr:hypothetical protein WH47_04814 [Habropoda laboriosa]